MVCNNYIICDFYINYSIPWGMRRLTKNKRIKKTCFKKFPALSWMQEVKNLVQKLQQSMQDFFATNAGKQVRSMAMHVKNCWSCLRNRNFANWYLGNTKIWWHDLFRFGCFLEAGGFLMMEVMFPLEVSIKYCQRCGLMWPAAMSSMSRNQEEGVSRALRNIFGNTKKVSGFKIGSLNISSAGRPVVFRSAWFQLKVVKFTSPRDLDFKLCGKFCWKTRHERHVGLDHHRWWLTW